MALQRRAMLTVSVQGYDIADVRAVFGEDLRRRKEGRQRKAEEAGQQFGYMLGPPPLPHLGEIGQQRPN